MVLDEDKPGYYEFDKNMDEKDVSHEFMQHIIDSREGIKNTAPHYEYYEDKKRKAKYLSESEPSKRLLMQRRRKKNKSRW